MATLNQTNSNEFDILKDSTLLYLEDEELIRKETLAIFKNYFKTIHSERQSRRSIRKYYL